MEQFLGLFKWKKNTENSDVHHPTEAASSPPELETVSQVDFKAKLEEMKLLSTRLAEAGYNLGAIEEEFERNVVGTNNADVFRYTQLVSELSYKFRVALVPLDAEFSGRLTVQSIIDQVTKDPTPVPDNFYTALEDRITDPCTLAVSVAPHLQPTEEITAFADMFRSLNSQGRAKGIVLYQDLSDVPREIARNIGYTPTPRV